MIYPPVPCGTQPPECKKTCTRPHDCDHPGKSGHSVSPGFFVLVCFFNKNVEKHTLVCLKIYLLFYYMVKLKKLAVHTSSSTSDW